MTVLQEPLHEFYTERELLGLREQYGPSVNLVAAGVCALIVDHDDRLFYALHAEKDGKYPNESVGTSSETFRWVPMRSQIGNRVTETPYEAWIRSLHEELALDRELFDKAGFTFEWRNPTSSGNLVNASPDGVENLLATNIFVRVQNPEALVFDTQTSEEILSTGFATLGEIEQMRPFRPGFLDWYRNAFEQYKGLIRDVEVPVDVEWTEQRLITPNRVDVKLV